MDSFAQLSTKDREDYFTEAASRHGLPPYIVEKDFWVCWTLKRLFALEDIGNSLLFKGGTSLSKVHKLIRRFSEDIDVSIHREKFGFTGERDPMSPGLGSNETKRLIAKLKEAIQAHVADIIRPALADSIGTALLADETSGTWSLQLDEDDADRQSLAFFYPPTQLTPEASHYIPPRVKIEFGARSDHWPAETKPIKPYVEEAIPESMEDPIVEVKAMAATRTFWEKATILHKIGNLRDGDPFPKHHSRHFTDLAAMIDAGIGEKAAIIEGLLEAVVEHKKVFYRQAWAKYKDAKKGSLKLLPAEKDMEGFKADLKSMEPMFFDDPPNPDDVIQTLSTWEDRFNSNP